MQVASVVSGLFFRARIDEVVQRFGTHSSCTGVDEIRSQQPHVILVDLEHPEALAVLREYGKSVIAFGPHLRYELLAVAREFGAQTYSRSVFFDDLDKILHQFE